MTRLLILLTVALTVLRPDLKLIATVNPAADAAADAWCLTHGCGDLEPMDALDA